MNTNAQTHSLQVAGIIVAAGRGERMGAIDKVFLPLLGRPAILYSWDAFERCELISRLVFVARPEVFDRFEALAASFARSKPYQLVPGGARRQDSVWNGLTAVPESTDIVVIHDAARPCVTPRLIQLTIEAALQDGAAVASTPVVDTIKEADPDGYILRHLDRSRLRAVQTPQTFRYQIIRHALELVQRQGLTITDDTAACEYIGQKVRLVLSPDPNPKLTYPEDISYIESILKKRHGHDW